MNWKEIIGIGLLIIAVVILSPVAFAAFIRWIEMVGNFFFPEGMPIY